MPTQVAERELAIQTFEFCREVEIAAPTEVTFEAVLAELGPEGTMPDGQSLSMKIEPWPGGRWYRDLGNNAGHLWGHVQVIKPRTLLEICGPMFVSYPAVNHLQYRLTGQRESTMLKITHRAHGYLPKGFLDGAEQGWNHAIKRIREIAERMRSARVRSW